MEKKPSPFDFVESVSLTKKNLLDQGRSEGEYVPFLTNRALSYHADAVLYANELNQNHHLDRRLQYDFLRAALRPRTRRGSWSRPDDKAEVEALGWYYGLGPDKARIALTIMSPDHVKTIIDIKKDHDQHG